MSWVPPPSFGRSLNRLSIGPARPIEGESSVLPTVGLLDLDQPPFRTTGLRFYGGGTIQADINGAHIALSTANQGCLVVVDQIVIAVSVAVTLNVALHYGAVLPGGIPVFVPEAQQRPIAASDARITARVGTLGGNVLYSTTLLANTPLIFPCQIVLPVPPKTEAPVELNVGVNITNNGVFLIVSFSGRIWYSEE